MDNPLLLVVIGVIVAVVIAAFFLPGWVRRRTRRAGERTEHAHARSHTAAALAQLGTTLLLHAPESESRDLVAEVAERHPRLFTRLTDGRIGIRFVDPDDAVAALVATDGGSLLRIDRTRELLGAPKGVEFWGELHALVSAEAAARGIEVTAGPPVRFDRHDGSPAVWVAAGEEQRS